MRVAILGSSGLIGTELISKLLSEGHEILRLKRSLKALKGNDIYFNYKEKIVSSERLEKLDAIINLAGESIASGYWSKQKKEDIYNSRIESSRFLADTIKKLKHPPQVVISASAIGFYGDQKAEILTEESTKGNGFLAKVCADWEEEINSLTTTTRVVNSRIGLVLSKKGGTLKLMLLPFKLGLGGNLGSGTQYMSWISLADLVNGFVFCIENKNISGPVNFVSTTPLRNSEFTKILAKSLNRPAFLHLPEFFLKLLLGEMAKELLLSSQRVLPKKLETAGFIFKNNELQAYLTEILA